MVGGLPSSNLWNIEYEDLIFKNIIGKGNFGCVYRGEYHGVEVAIKQIPSYDDPDYCKYTEREVKALRYIRHPLIVHFFGCCQHSSGFYLVTEFIDGMDLRRFLKSIPKPPSWLSRVNIALGVAKTFLFLHSKNILHRDLKSKNILLDVTRNQIKLCDFGFARIGSQYSNGSDSSSSDDDENNNNNNNNNTSDEVYNFNGNGKNANYKLRRMSVCGTPSFMAPEILLQRAYDWTIDVFSFGILLSELITLKRPGKDYWVRSQNNGFDINTDELIANIPSPNDCPVQFYDLALMCCSYKHTSRPKFSTIIHILESIKDTLESKVNQQTSNNSTTTTSNQFLQIPTLSQQISNSIDSNNSNSIMSNSNNSLISRNQKSSIINNHHGKNNNNQTTSVDSIITNPISIFKERKKPQSFNKLLKVNTSTLIDHDSSSSNGTGNTGLLSTEREGVIKLNQSKYINGWKEFGIDSTTSKIWIIYQSNIIKINSNNNNNNNNNNLIEITCGTIIKLKKHSITISITDSNLINGINIINVKSYLKDYPHISTPIKSNNFNGKQLKSNNGKGGGGGGNSGGSNSNDDSNYDIKSIIKIQSIVRCWLVRRRFKSFNSNWKLTNSNTIQTNKRQWITLFNQLISSELEYKIQLDHVIKSYLLPLQSKFRINKPLINYKEIGSIFSNIESLSEIHSELLKIVNQISKSPYFIMNFENEPTIGDLSNGDQDGEYFTNVSINTKNSSNQINSITQFIVKNISQIKNQYGIFAFNFKYSTNIFNWCKLNPDFANFIESIRIQLNQQYPDQENDLSSLLSLPINKIQKYLLIFEKLAQITPIAHSEYKDIKAAFTLIKETSNYIQSQLEMSFEHSHIMSIDVMLQKKDNQSLVQSGRWFIKQGLFDSGNGNNSNNGTSNNNGKQYYLFLLSDILLITKPIKSKSKSSTSSSSSSSTLKKELNLSSSFQNLSHHNNNNNNNNISTNTNTTTSSKDSVVVNNLKYYYRLRKTINLKEEEIIMRINPEIPNGVIFTTCSTNKSYRWILQSEEDAKDWVNEFERITVILSGIKSSGNGNQQSMLPSSQSNLDFNEVNQIHQINQSNSNGNGGVGINNSGERGFIKRFRLSFSSGSDSSRKASLANITNTSSLNNLGDCSNGAGSGSGSSSSSNSNTPTTPIKSVLSSPSIHYTPTSNNNNNNNSTPNFNNDQPEFQFLVPTTPASEKKKKRNSFSSKLKRLSVTFSTNPTNDHKKNSNKEQQQQEN